MHQGISDMMHDQMKLIEVIQTSIKHVQSETDKIKFENMLQKKINAVEYFSKILIQHDQDFLKIQHAQVKLFKKLKIQSEEEEQKEKSSKGKYELQSLLDESDSDEESKKPLAQDDDTDSGDDYENVNDPEISQMLELEQEVQGGQDDFENQQIAQLQHKMTDRTQRIQEVNSSIGKIQEMFKDLNQIVV